MPYDISEKKRDWYREVSHRSLNRKKAAMKGTLPRNSNKIDRPVLKPHELMPQLPYNGLKALSLFSGGGGLDLGFERAGLEHVASFDILDICGETLKVNRPQWKVFGTH